MNSLSANRLDTEAWLSEADLWRRVAHYYGQPGVNVWKEQIPFQITSNPCIAAAYADTLIAYLEDWVREHGALTGKVNIVELGAGHGLFSTAMLRALAERSASLGALPATLHYWVTDRSPNHLESWRQNPELVEFQQSGMCGFCCFDALENATLPDGWQQPTQEKATPWIFIANYVFDTLPHDAFLFGDNETKRGVVTVEQYTPAPTLNPDTYQISLAFRSYQLTSLTPLLAAAVQGYQALQPTGCLLIPTGALQCIEQLRQLSGDNMLLLCADKGWSRLETAMQVQIENAIHFSNASMTVNLHAISEHVTRAGGIAFSQTTQQESLSTAAWVFGMPGNKLIATRTTFANQLDKRSPGDLYGLAATLLTHRFNLGLAEIVSLLKLMNWDPAIFDGCFDAILASLSHAPLPAVADLRAALPTLAAQRYRSTHMPDTLFNIAHLQQCLGLWSDAAQHYRLSIQERGDTAQTWYNLGLCHAALQENNEAVTCFDKASALDPEMLLAQGWLYRLGKTIACVAISK
ncbi:SAM-dependent methyltransferase [Undibacterium sp. SXout7W]|uniref:SAM-dependent methyltransferase n=1 Tax=Undibacterium sp. SXout7W TaxID=3413049 RepID=UPI003BF39583